MVNWQEIHPDFTEELQTKWIEKGFSVDETKKWIEAGLQVTDAGFCVWLTNTKKMGSFLVKKLVNKHLEKLRKEYETEKETNSELDNHHYKKTKQKFEKLDIGSQELKNLLEKDLGLSGFSRNDDTKDGNVQEWLDKNYPKKERKWKSEIYLNEPSLEGELDLGGFDYYDEWLGGVKVYIAPSVDETKLTFRNLPKDVKIIAKVVIGYDEFDCLAKEEKVRTEVIDISKQNLTGELDLSDFVNLKELICSHNKLTSLNLSNCSQLEKINCSDNLLTAINLPTNITNLKKLWLNNNNFLSQDLSFLVPATNLEELRLENNKFTGSLNYLSGIRKLKTLDISNTDLNEVNIEKLPRSLEEIIYFTKYRDCITKYRVDCKLTEIVPELDKVKFAFCQRCYQPNTSENWCQSCQEKEWQQLTGQELVEKFIEQQPTDRYGTRDKLQWIPYQQFTNIEKIGEGGFSQIYKAGWKGGKWGDEDETVVLKSLNNSQNITLEFLQEIANTKLVDSRSDIVKCYGISQDPKTKNYVMVMEYMDGGNLRDCLKNKNGELSLEDKLSKLLLIANALSDIHHQNLIHRDFHSGNILNDSWRAYITDLGLSCLANSQKQEGKIFGVLPYVAPEILQGKPYTQASDIYSFGIVAYELLANSYPYPAMEDTDFALKVCDKERPLRPDIDKVPIPQELKDLIKSCWDANPEKRPGIEELNDNIDNQCDNIRLLKKIEINKDTPAHFYHQYYQYQSLEQEYNTFSQSTSLPNLS